MTRMRVFQSWNTPEMAEGLRSAWRDDAPILLLNPSVARLEPVAAWLDSATDPGRGRPDGFQALLLTSGTTGEPRLVALDRRSVSWNADTVADHLQLPADGSLLARLHVPLFHAFGLALVFFLAERRGGRISRVSRFDPEALLDWLTGAAPDLAPGPDDHLLLPLVPAMIRSLPSADLLPGELRRRLARVRGTSITGGDRVTRADMEALHALLPGMVHTIGYGLTEAGPALAHTSPADGRIPVVDGLAGRPLPGVEFVSRGGRFRSPGQAVAILERGSEAWQPVRGAWLPTGDLLEPVPGGKDLLQVVGRTSWCFKRKGETVSPVSVEEALARSYRDICGNELPRTLVLGLEGDTLVLRVEGAPDPVIESALRSASLELPSFLRPGRVAWVTRFPRNALGKIVRN